MTRKEVMQALATVVDPDKGHDLARLGLIHDLEIEGDTVSFTVQVDDPRRPFAGQVADLCRRART